MSTTSSRLNAKPIFVVNRIVSNITGLNQAMLQRAKLLAEYSNQKIKIVSFFYDPRHYSTLQEKLRASDKINDLVDVINMYEYFKGEMSVEVQTPPQPRYDGYFIEKKKNALRYFLKGKYIKYEKYTEGELLERADYFDDSRYCYKSEEYDQKGNIAKVQYKDLLTGQTRNEMHHRSNGSVFMSKWFEFDKNNSTNKIIRINIFDQKGDIKKVLYSEEELRHYFLDCIVGNEESIVFAEARSVDKLIVKYGNKKVRKMAIIHSMHLEPPYDNDSAIDSSHKVMLANMSAFDAVVVLTNKQREDIEQKIGKQEKLYVIPHANRIQPNLQAKPPTSTTNRIVIVARLTYKKQLDHAIKAMEIVTKTLPDASLHIFGEGDERASLTRLITDLQLGKHVFLEGFSDNPIAEYSHADLSLFTSHCEGFGLSVLESLSQGCPVVSYDLPYGPSDMIINGENGYLVERNNIDMLAAKTVEALSDKKTLQLLSKAATKSVDRFDEKSFTKKWVELFNNAWQ
jgi:glycosyltransferase involved in cell wall biosynthesis